MMRARSRSRKRPRRRGRRRGGWSEWRRRGHERGAPGEWPHLPVRRRAHPTRLDSHDPVLVLPCVPRWPVHAAVRPRPDREPVTDPGETPPHRARRPDLNMRQVREKSNAPCGAWVDTPGRGAGGAAARVRRVDAVPVTRIDRRLATFPAIRTSIRASRTRERGERRTTSRVVRVFQRGEAGPREGKLGFPAVSARPASRASLSPAASGAVLAAAATSTDAPCRAAALPRRFSGPAVAE